MTLRKEICASLLLLAAAIIHALGQTNMAESASMDWVARNWQTKDGLPQNTPYAITQTPDGYLWVGTSGGLARFDGFRFRAFGLQDGLRSVQIFQLCVDHAGVLWVGTVGGGLSRWDNGKFTTFGAAEGFRAGIVQALAAAPDGTLWIGTESGLVRGQNGGFKTIGADAGLPATQVRALLFDSKGRLWVSALNKGLYRSVDGDRFAPIEAAGLPAGGIYSLLESRDGSVWAGATSQLWNWRDGIWKRYAATNGLPRSELQSLAEGADGALWVGARKGGLFCFRNGRASPLSTDAEALDQSVLRVFIDREGLIWTGSAAEGLSRLSPRNLQQWGRAEGLVQPRVSSVTEDGNGELWLGTQSDGFWRFSGQQFRRLKDPVVGQNHSTVYSVISTDDGSIWGAGEQFLVRFRADEATRVFVKPPIQGEAIRALCADGTNLWVGTYYSTLLKVEGTNVTVVATNGSFGGNITSIVREGPETLWVGTGDGLYRWERGQTKSWTTRDGLLAANIQALHRDPDGTLWIGTLGGGLARLKAGRIVNCTGRDGLVDDVILQIVTDDLGHLWLGGNRGLMCLERNELNDFAEGRVNSVHPIAFNEDDGMLNTQCAGGHSPTAMKRRNGRLVFPTAGGLVEVDPQRMHPATSKSPPAIIEGVTLDEQPLTLDATVTVPPGDHRLEMSYSSPSLRGADWVRFRTRLEGLNPDWTITGTRRRTAYDNLRPGRYRFQVSACNSKGEWSENPATLAIIVEPHFWQASWFVSLIILSAGGTAVVWYRRRIAQLESRRKAQETFTRQLIGAQEAERSRLARELHDDITQRLARLAIDAGRVERTSGTPQVAGTMREVREGLVRLSEDVHSLSYRLHSSLLEDLGLAEALKAECERFSRQESVFAEVKLRELPSTLPGDASLGLFRIAQEALRNVARHARARNVEVTSRLLDDGLQLAVRDDGNGFDPSRKPDHTSLGLASMRERVALLGGELDIESSPGHGTTVVAWVPLNKQGT